MRMVSAVYQLKPNLIDPKFDGFVYVETNHSGAFEKAYDVFYVEDRMSLMWQPRKPLDEWKPLPVSGPVNPFNDYPCLDLAIPAFSGRAVNALGTMLTKNGVLLALETDVGEYFAYIGTTKIDALDLRKSRFERSCPDEVPLHIDYFSFLPNKLADATIFRIPEQPNCYFVTDLFKQRVEQAKLNGFNFVPVWPLPEDADWMLLAKAEREKQAKKVKLAGHSLVIRFALKGQQPNDTEQNLSDELVNSLLAKLRLNSLDEKYHGSLETFEFVDGEFRMFCTCPDAEELASYLDDWLKHVLWPGDVSIIKRYGNLYDKKIKVKQLAIRKANG